MGTNLQGEWLSRPPELKGEIAWSYTRPVHVRVKSATKFDLVTPGRDFHLCSYEPGAEVWVQRIDATLNMQSQRRRLGRAPSGEDATSGSARTSDEDTLLELLERPSEPVSGGPHTKRSSCQLFLEDVSANEGWLWKQGKHTALSLGSRTPSFKKRYAVLRGLQLFYYKDEPGYGVKRAPTGVVRCESCCAVAGCDEPAKFPFDIVAETGRTFHVYAATDSERTKWLRAISDVLQDARD